MQEHELRKLGIFIIPVPIPFRRAGGPVNVYLVEEEQGFLLFDTGLGTEESRAALGEGFARRGHRFEDLNRIILSHGHIDHYGAAAWLQEQAGREVPTYLHIADSSKVLRSGPDLPTLLTKNSKYLSSLGVPIPIQHEMAAVIRRNGELGRRLANLKPLLPGDLIPCRHITLEVLHMPGHTPGLCCLYEREHKLLFSADHLLERVSPNPLIELGMGKSPPEFKALVSYFQSIERLHSLDINLVLPGHGTPFNNYLEIINSLYDFYRRRQEKLLDALNAVPLTVYEAMGKLFESGQGIELFLMLSETLGNLECLEDAGRIVREHNTEGFRFCGVE